MSAVVQARGQIAARSPSGPREDSWHPRSRSRLSREDLAALRAELEQLRAFRMDQLVQLAGQGTTGPLASADSEVARVLRAGAWAAFVAVQHALRRIEQGTYGRCVDCSDEISLAELQAVPHAVRCLRCRHAASPG